MTELAEIDRAIDGILVQLGQMVLRLSNAGVTNNAEERQALARSVNQFSVCAAHSGDVVRRCSSLKEAACSCVAPGMNSPVNICRNDGWSAPQPRRIKVVIALRFSFSCGSRFFPPSAKPP